MAEDAATIPEPLYQHLKAGCGPAWAAYVDHRFVRQLAAGDLPEPAFRRYLIQDYLFLVQFARAYGLAAFKAESLEDIRQAAAGLNAIVDREIGLHVAYCEGWGLGEADMAASPEADATLAYTRYVLERGLAGDGLDLAVALAPCICGYGEIGRMLAADPATRWEGNPYAEWIRTYADPGYQAVAAAHATHLDTLMARRGGPGRLPGLARVFADATRLEAAFWESALADTAAPTSGA